MRVSWALLFVALLAGCSAAPTAVHTSHPRTTPPATTHAGPTTYVVACFLLDLENERLATGGCQFTLGATRKDVPIGPGGNASFAVPLNANMTVVGHAPGYAPNRVSFVVDRPTSVRLHLAPNATEPDFDPNAPAANNTPDSHPVAGRHWLSPVTVDSNGYGAEPQVAVGPDGTVYVAPASTIFRSTNGGRTFQGITPGLPTLGSDDSLSVAPDGALWWTDYWAYAGTDQACVSTDKGSGWSCDFVAHPGVNDRMWIVGLSATEAYLQSGQAAQVPQYDHTVAGATKFVPYAEGIDPVVGQLGSMVYDPVAKQVWQVGSGSPLTLLRVDGQVGVVGGTSTGVDGTYAISNIATADGALWVTAESGGKVAAARSLDQGKTWRTFTVSQAPAEASFSAVAAGPHGRAAVIYLGSDKAGGTQPNGGTWSLYIAETDDALSATPTWVEKQLVQVVHKGDLCTGLNCENNGADGAARLEGDIIGVAIDKNGNAHVAYIQDSGGSYPVVSLSQG